MFRPTFHIVPPTASSAGKSYSFRGQDSPVFFTCFVPQQIPEDVLTPIASQIEKASIQTSAQFFELFQSLSTVLAVHQASWTSLFIPDKQPIVVAGVNSVVWLRRGEKVGRVLTAQGEMRIIEGNAQMGDEYWSVLQLSETSAFDGEGFLRQAPSMAQVFTPESQLLTQYPDLLCSGVSIQEGEAETAPTAVVETVSEKLGEPEVDQTLPKQPRVVPVARSTPSVGQAVKSLSTQLPKLRKRSLKKLLPVLIVVIVIAVVAIGLSMRSARQQAGAQELIAPFSQQLTSVQDLASEDSIDARDQLASLEEEFAASRGEFDKNRFTQKEAEAFAVKLQQVKDQISGQIELETLPTFYDFRLVRSDFIASQASIDGDTAVFLDSDKKTMVSLHLDTKKQNILPIGEYGFIRGMSVDQEVVYILSDGIYAFPIDSQNPAVKIIPEGDSNRTGQLIDTFESFIYVFNPEQRNIFRYQKTMEPEDEVEPVGWFQDKKDLDFETISSMSIDGLVWIGTQDGKILKYERGVGQEFSISGLPEAFNSNVKVFTAPDSQYIYVLEPAQERVVILDKEGVFIKEIRSPSLGAASDIIAREDAQTLYVVAGSLVYTVSF